MLRVALVGFALAAFIATVAVFVRTPLAQMPATIPAASSSILAVSSGRP